MLDIRTGKRPAYELNDEEFGSLIRIVPEAGGIITHFNIRGNDIFYLFPDQDDEGALVPKGGNPVLFPICSRLPDEGYTYKGKFYPMPMHGFARDMGWQVKDPDNANTDSVTLELTDNEATMAMYPFKFRVGLTYKLNGSELQILQTYTNHSKGDMPLYPGFHPYFTVGDKARLQFDISAARYTCHSEQKVVEYKGSIDFNQTVNHVFQLTGSGGHTYSMLDPVMKRRVVIETAPEFKIMVMWTLDDKNFVCLEPWTAAPNAMNTGEDLIWLAPGRTLETWIKIRVEQL